DGDVNSGNFCRFGAWANNLAPGPFLDRKVSAGMIEVMMRVENMRQAPALLAGLIENARRIGSIDCRGLPGGPVVNEIAVIVFEARKLVNLEHQRWLLGLTLSCHGSTSSP